MVKPTTVRIVLSLAAQHRWSLRQLDVRNAFLHDSLKERVYMRQPHGFIDPHYPTHVCSLQKSLYGFRQALGRGLRSFPHIFSLWVSQHLNLIFHSLFFVKTPQYCTYCSMWMTLYLLVATKMPLLL
jgi:hypothetical protein